MFVRECAYVHSTRVHTRVRACKDAHVREQLCGCARLRVRACVRV